MANLGKRNETQLFTIVVGSPQTLEAAEFSIPYPATVFANPGSGGTLLVEYRISPAGSWIAWPDGTVAVDTVYLLNGPVEALRFTALLADGTVEVAQ
jgi:hypothetical protein